jgi:hypothetical protein
MPAIPTNLFETIDLKCTASQIHELLKRIKLQTGEARIGATKEEMLKNLRDAVDRHMVPTEQLHALVRESEENGDQHILYFTPKSQSAGRRSLSADEVGKALFGSRWESSGRFPSFKTEPRSYVWSDFRRNSGEQGWTAKLYGHEIRLRFSREKEERHVLTRYYEKLDDRVVCLARRVDQELLEVRIGRAGVESRKKVEQRANAVWEKLAPALQESDWQPWDLTKTFVKMLKTAKKNEDVYRISDANFRDSAQGVATFSTQTSEESLSESRERDSAVKLYLENGGVCRQIAVTFDADSASGIWGEEPLRVICGGFNSNEIVIPATVNAISIDYVTNQFRHFGN